MRRMNVERMKRYATGSSTTKTEQVRPEDIRVGDTVLVAMDVYQIEPANPGGARKHIRARVDWRSHSLWQMGDQYVWTWGWSMADDAKRIERIVK